MIIIIPPISPSPHINNKGSGPFYNLYVSLELGNGIAVLCWDASRNQLSGVLQAETMTRSTQTNLGEANNEPYLSFQKLPISHKGFEFDHTQFTMSHIAIHPNGKYLYMAQRGLDMLFTFSIDQDEATAGNFVEPLSPTRFVVPDGPSAGCGKIKLVSQCKTHGKCPRNFACNPDGSEIWIANQVGL